MTSMTCKERHTHSATVLPARSLHACMLYVTSTTATVIQPVTASASLLFFSFIGSSSMPATCNAAVTLHTRTCRNQLTDDNILLQAKQLVDFTFDRCIGQEHVSFPGRSCGQEGICLQRCFRNTEQYRFSNSRLFSGKNSFAVSRFIFMNINECARQQRRIACINDTDFTKHLLNHNFDVLIVDFYPLVTVYALYFLQECSSERREYL